MILCLERRSSLLHAFPPVLACQPSNKMIVAEFGVTLRLQDYDRHSAWPLFTCESCSASCVFLLLLLPLSPPPPLPPVTRETPWLAHPENFNSWCWWLTHVRRWNAYTFINVACNGKWNSLYFLINNKNLLNESKMFIRSKKHQEIKALITTFIIQH